MFHIGAIVHNTDDGTLHGVSWGTALLSLDTGRDGTVWHDSPERLRTFNTSHYLDYQTVVWGAHARTGVTEMRQPRQRRRSGWVASSRPPHQVPVLLWTASGLDMTHNPVWLEPTAAGVRGYFMPEDEKSTIYVYDVDAR